ncbi:MAG TPA: GntR family transcriptional regulator [Pseudonocardiaceae bacterium]|jgi:DNA-binding GntR family transcriptional regulator
MTLADLQPVNQDSTAAIIARQLRGAIMAGALPPGAQLGEADLAARFQVSRGPLREAMQRLVQEGLLRSERNRGLFVIELEPADVFDIYVARNAIEQAAARLILRANRGGIVADELAVIHAELAAALKAGDAAAIGDADGRFHEEFVRASGSKRLTRMSGTLLVESRMCIGALQRTYQPEEDQLAEHGAIVDGLRGGNEIALLKLIESHMEDAVVRLVPGFSLNGPGPVRQESDAEPMALPPVVTKTRRRPARKVSKR